MKTGTLFSIQIGQPERRTLPNGRVWVSAIGKTPVAGPIAVHRENLEGDAQANRKFHGGPYKAVCWYSFGHQEYWRAALGLELPPGAFGENITLKDLTESEICVGDTLAAGSAVFQVTQPRLPCANPGKLWNSPELPLKMEESGYTGFYTRVLQTGEIEAGQEVRILERPCPEWDILRANQVMHSPDSDPALMEALRQLPLLSPEWKRVLARKLKLEETA